MHRALDESEITFRVRAETSITVVDIMPPSQRDKTCPRCHFPTGQPGWVRMDWPVGHPLFGQAIRCPRCREPF